MDDESEETLWYQPDLDVFLNRWYSNYAEARDALSAEDEFLLPYRRHFYVCQPEVISALGLDPADADWEKIGRDCAQPADSQAYERLREKRAAVVRERRS
jgi:hypothetical protein